MRFIGREDVKWLLTEQIPHLRRYARALTGDVHQADDLVQDCLERALRNYGRLRQRRSVRAWAFKILYREFLGRRRRKSRVSESGVDDDAASIAASQFERLHCQDVVGALGNLPHEQRAAVALVALEEVTYDEAARMLDIPVGTLRSRLSRGRAALRVAMSAEPDKEHDSPADSEQEEAPRAALRCVK